MTSVIESALPAEISLHRMQYDAIPKCQSVLCDNNKIVTLQMAVCVLPTPNVPEGSVILQRNISTSVIVRNANSIYLVATAAIDSHARSSNRWLLSANTLGLFILITLVQNVQICLADREPWPERFPASIKSISRFRCFAR